MNVMLVDVDGVFNEFTGFSNDERINKLVSGDIHVGMAHLGYQIAWYPAVLDRILSFHDRGLAEFRWLTTWEDEANTLLQGLFEKSDRFFEVAGYEKDHRSYNWWWKELIVKDNYLDYDGKVVWIDDELNYSNREDYSSDTFLQVRPYPALTHKDLDNIERFLTS